MDRAEHQVPGLSRGDGQRHGLAIAHLSDHDHVRVFAERCSQRLREALGVRADLALVDLRFGRHEVELDRIFNRDDVFLAVLIHQLYHGGQGRGLAAAVRPRDQDEPLIELGEAPQLLGEAQLCERRNAGLHDPEGTVPPHPLLDNTGTVHALVRDDIAKVERQLRGDAPALFVGQNLKQESFGFCGGERRSRKRRELTVLPDDGGRRHVDVQVRAPDIAGVGQIVVQVSERGDFRRVRLGDQRTGGGINFRSRNRSRGGRWPWIFASHRAG